MAKEGSFRSPKGMISKIKNNLPRKSVLFISQPDGSITKIDGTDASTPD